MSERLARARPFLLGALLWFALCGPALRPDVQLWYRDTGRCMYHFKQFTAAALRAGRSPFWDPWTEAGTSVLAQMTPGLFHPGTLLYALPFELAFKLNHLLAIALAWVAAYLLARRLRTSRWAAAAAASAYAGSGYLVSVTSSNLHYALGAAQVPLALHALLLVRDRPRPGRLLWASFALALCVYGGEPQSALLAGLLGAALVVRSPRTAGLVAAWGACALLLAAPAVLPALGRISRSPRFTGLARAERESFATAPLRLPGVLLPWAFDDTQEAATTQDVPTFTEYFAGKRDSAFIDSIALGAPALLLALLACFGPRRRDALWCVAGAAFFLSASCGGGLAYRVAELIPGMRLFRYPEKLVAPAVLLLALGAALGVDEAVRAPRRLLRAAMMAAVLLFGIFPLAPLLRPALIALGHSHSPQTADAFLRALRGAALAEGALCAAVAAVSLHRLRAPGLALTCAVAAAVQSSGVLFTIPLEVFHAPLLLAQELTGRAGPSAHAWRMRGDDEQVRVFKDFDLRLGRWVASQQLLNPQFHALAGIESVSSYAAIDDGDYTLGLSSAPSATAQVLGVRFDVVGREKLAQSAAAELRYQQAAFGTWVKEFPARPRAFLAGCAEVARDAPAAARALVHLDVNTQAVLREGAPVPPCPAAPQGTVTAQRPSDDRIDLDVQADAPALVVVSEHYDEGWRVTVDGAPGRALQTDLVALGVPVAPGHHVVRLHFVPALLWPGLALALVTALGLSALELAKRDDRVGATEPERV